MTLRLDRVKIALSILGLCLAAGGVIFDYRPLVTSAIVALSFAVAIRLYLRRRVDHQGDSIE